MPPGWFGINGELPVDLGGCCGLPTTPSTPAKAGPGAALGLETCPT